MLLLTGPEVVNIIRDIMLVLFLFFGFFALAVFTVLSVLQYRRTAALFDALTSAARHGDHVLDDLGEITERARDGSALPGAAVKGVFAALTTLVMGARRRRRRGDRRSG